MQACIMRVVPLYTAGTAQQKRRADSTGKAERGSTEGSPEAVKLDRVASLVKHVDWHSTCL